MTDFRITALVIDDDPSDVEILDRYLERIPGWEVKLHSFHDSESALDGLNNHNVDIILLDYLLGAETGLDVLYKLQEAGITIPVVAMTGHGSEEVAVSMMQRGALDYLPKSAISEKTLKRTLFTALERHRLVEEVEHHRQELIKTNQELTRKNDEMRGFHFTISHEIRNPLAAALEFLTMLLEGFAGDLDEDKRMFVDSARDSCQVINRHIADLLDATRLETGKFLLNLQPTSTTVLLRKTLASMGHAARDYGISLCHDFPDNLPDVKVDANRLRQVLTNLLDNAFKFTGAGGEVWVRAKIHPDNPKQLMLSVADNGIGIDPEQVNRIFDRHYQARKDDAEFHAGLGLGLNICREIIQQHGCEIGVESTMGQGSIFTFTLPIDLPRDSEITKKKKQRVMR